MSNLQNSAGVSVLPNVDVTHLDKVLLNESKQMRLLPAATLQEIPRDELRVWAAKNARYQLVTAELVDWLREQIAGRSAIEVGAGMGDIGRHLQIPMSDSAIQTMPDLAAYYRLLGQTPTEPPADVEQLGAEAAIAKYLPEVVIGSWITQKYQAGDVHGSVYGPDEFFIREHCACYIHIGNENSHGQKRLLRLPHTTLRRPWLVSRAADPTKNLIYVWEK